MILLLMTMTMMTAVLAAALTLTMMMILALTMTMMTVLAMTMDGLFSRETSDVVLLFSENVGKQATCRRMPMMGA
jgi:hypothetical protein